MVTRSPLQEAKQTVEHLEVLRAIAEESAFQSRLATWAAIVGALAAILAAVFGFLSYMHMRTASTPGKSEAVTAHAPGGDRSTGD